LIETGLAQCMKHVVLNVRLSIKQRCNKHVTGHTPDSVEVQMNTAGVSHGSDTLRSTQCPPPNMLQAAKPDRLQPDGEVIFS